MKKRTYSSLNRNFSKERISDRLTVRERSHRMSLIRSKSTSFEQNFIAVLKMQTREAFTTNDLSILGKPDIVFNKHRVCVFVDSNFWHGWQYSHWKHLLKNDFWRDKIERNRMRDKKVTRKLRNEGWIVLRFWEYQIKKDQFVCMKKVTDALEQQLWL